MVRTKVVILDRYSITDTEEVTDLVRMHLSEKTTGEIKVNITKKAAASWQRVERVLATPDPVEGTEKGWHKAAECDSTPQRYLCAAKEEKPRTDPLPGTTRCMLFREAALMRKPQNRQQ